MLVVIATSGKSWRAELPSREVRNLSSWKEFGKGYSQMKDLIWYHCSVSGAGLGGGAGGRTGEGGGFGIE